MYYVRIFPEFCCRLARAIAVAAKAKSSPTTTPVPSPASIITKHSILPAVHALVVIAALCYWTYINRQNNNKSNDNDMSVSRKGGRPSAC